MIRFRENHKKPYLGAILCPLWPKTGHNFFLFGKSGSLFEGYSFLQSCKKSENFNDPNLRKAHNEPADRRTQVRTDTCNLRALPCTRYSPDHKCISRSDSLLK